MGYTTQFYVEFKIDPPVTKEFKNYINAFSDTRHCRWNAKGQIPCWELFSWKGDPGEDGMYFAMPRQLQKYFIRDSFPDADDQRPDLCTDANENPVGVPGFWGDWRINDEGNLSWSGAEKFYWYVQWLYFLIVHFSEPAGYKLTGKVRYEGGDPYDRGYILPDQNSWLNCRYGYLRRYMKKTELNCTGLWKKTSGGSGNE